MSGLDPGTFVFVSALYAFQPLGGSVSLKTICLFGPYIFTESYTAVPSGL